MPPVGDVTRNSLTNCALLLTAYLSTTEMTDTIATNATKPVIAVDIDEVLAFFLPAVANFHNENYESNLTAESFFSYEFHQVWGGTPEETTDKVLCRFFEL